MNLNTTQILKENIDENLCGLGLGKGILDIIQNVWSIKEKCNKFDLGTFALQNVLFRE